MTRSALEPACGEAMISDKMVLRPLIGLMQGRDPGDVERFTIAEMEKHRLLRDEAVRLEARCRELGDEEERGGAEHDYVAAMIAVHAQQTVVSTLLDILGFIPKTPVKIPH
jgi:hypothetical protein